MEQDDDTLRVRLRDGHTSKEFSLPLNVLLDTPSRVRTKATAALIFSCGFGIATLLALFGVIMAPQLGARLSAAFTLALFGFAGSAGLARWRQLAYDVLVFYNRFNGQPALTLYYRKPDEKSFDQFVTKFIARIRLAQADTALPQTTMSIPRQIEAYARLAAEGLISTTEFDQIKRGLLESAVTAAKQIGFSTS